MVYQRCLPTGDRAYADPRVPRVQDVAEGVRGRRFVVRDRQVNDREAFADLIRENFDNFGERKRLYGNDDAPPMTPYAPRVCYNGRRSELKALLRRAVSPVADIRDPIQLVHDRIAARTSSLESACRLTNGIA